VSTDISCYLKVLVVDDQPLMHAMLRNILQKIGFKKIFLAADGNEALNILKTENIGLVLTDLNMPNVTGYELLQKIRQSQSSSSSVLSSYQKDLPVIVISCEDEQEKVIKAIQAGADNFIIKPFTVQMVREKIIRTLVKKREILAALGLTSR